MSWLSTVSFFFFFNDTATTEIYTLSLHDALPISSGTHLDVEIHWDNSAENPRNPSSPPVRVTWGEDRKSTRLNSSHGYISYAVFCLKKKKQTTLSPSLRPSCIDIIAHCATK